MHAWGLLVDRGPFGKASGQSQSASRLALKSPGRLGVQHRAETLKTRGLNPRHYSTPQQLPRWRSMSAARPARGVGRASDDAELGA